MGIRGHLRRYRRSGGRVQSRTNRRRVPCEQEVGVGDGKQDDAGETHLAGAIPQPDQGGDDPGGAADGILLTSTQTYAIVGGVASKVDDQHESRWDSRVMF